MKERDDLRKKVDYYLNHDTFIKQFNTLNVSIQRDDVVLLILQSELFKLKECIIILEKEKKVADRIIMNLPFSAHDFFTYALDIISENCVIHYYTITEDEEIEKTIKNLKKIAKIKKERL